MSQYSDSVPTPGSLDLGRLVQKQLLKAQQELPARGPRTLDDLRTMVNELSNISKICEDYMENVTEKPVARAFKEMEYGFEWAQFLQDVQIGCSPPAPTFLFRADRRTGPLSSYLGPAERRWSFNKFRRCHPLNDFLDALARHLGKTREGVRSNKLVDTKLTSMNPILEWAVHTTGQKWKDKADNEQVELVIFDLEKLKKTPGVGVFRVSDVLQFLEKQNKTHIIDAELQRWARNCDEYVTVGATSNNGLIRSIPWEELRMMPIVSDTFTKAYTLEIYRKWRAERQDPRSKVERDEVCSQVLESAKIIAGREQEDVKRVGEIISLILMPSIWFWGIETDTTENEVRIGCTKLLEGDELWQKLHKVSISSEE